MVKSFKSFLKTIYWVVEKMLNDEMLAKIASLYNISNINNVWFELNLTLDDEAELQNLLTADETELDVDRITSILKKYPPLKPYIEKQSIKVDYIKESLSTCDSSSSLHVKDLLDESVIKHFKNKQIQNILTESLKSNKTDEYIKEQIVEMISPLNSSYMMMLENDGITFEERQMKKLFEDLEPIQPIGPKQPVGTISQEQEKKEQEVINQALSTMTSDEIEQRADLASGVNTGENKQNQETNQDFASDKQIENMSRDELEAEIKKMQELIDA